MLTPRKNKETPCSTPLARLGIQACLAGHCPLLLCQGGLEAGEGLASGRGVCVCVSFLLALPLEHRQKSLSPTGGGRGGCPVG